MEENKGRVTKVRRICKSSDENSLNLINLRKGFGTEEHRNLKEQLGIMRDKCQWTDARDYWEVSVVYKNHVAHKPRGRKLIKIALRRITFITF